MRHRVRGKLLGREKAAREALMVHLAQALIRSGKITTTLAKAKAARPFVERVVTLGKKGGLSSRRQLIARLRSATLADRVLTTIAPKFHSRPGGYTRILKLGTRAGDHASLARLEFVD